jgi:hypothetical protein
VKGHFIENTTVETSLAIILIVCGCLLVWDSFDNRGKDLPWYARWFSFW